MLFERCVCVAPCLKVCVTAEVVTMAVVVEGDGGL